MNRDETSYSLENEVFAELRAKPSSEILSITQAIKVSIPLLAHRTPPYEVAQKMAASCIVEDLATLVTVLPPTIGLIEHRQNPSPGEMTEYRNRAISIVKVFNRSPKYEEYMRQARLVSEDRVQEALRGLFRLRDNWHAYPAHVQQHPQALSPAVDFFLTGMAFDAFDKGDYPYEEYYMAVRTRLHHLRS